MPMVRNRDANGVDVLLGCQLTEVIVLTTIIIAVVFVYLPDGFGSPAGIDVADGKYSTVIFLQEAFNVAHPHTAEPDEA